MKRKKKKTSLLSFFLLLNITYHRRYSLNIYDTRQSADGKLESKYVCRKKNL